MYSKYYEQHKADRNDLLGNAEVAFQTFAFDRANISALRMMNVNKDTARILDVGCGSGAGLIQFLRLGFRPDQLSGIDISKERIDHARRSLPNVDFMCESAEALSYATGTFDIVFESTMFVLLPSEDMARAIASEMVRVTRPGGYLMLVDWRYSRPGSDVYKAMNSSRIADLFGVGKTTSVAAREKGALVPPLGRFLSRRIPSLYFAAQALFPFAVGQVTTVLKKA
ncbi:MAG: class I SAM-dependent methyltransferase [Gemmatimonadaceae bacterium]